MDVFTGPIRPRLEGSRLRTLRTRGGARSPRWIWAARTPRTRYAWGANMAIRRERPGAVGPFDVTLEHGGDEQEWQDRLIAAPPASAH